MSHCDPTDLLCASRREELTLHEQRRLRESLQYSFEVRLMSGILSELERDSRVRPGDDVVLARINARALSGVRPRAAPIKAHGKRRTLVLLVAAAVLLVAGLAGAWLGGARSRRAPPTHPLHCMIGSAGKPKRGPTPAPSVVPVDARSIESSEPSEPTPDASTKTRDAKGSPPRSVSELFARANSLRRQGRPAEAAVLYQLLLDSYPTAREVGPARLALAKYLQTKQPERALGQFLALARAGGALRAEALWGFSEVATTLDRRSVSQQALADLLREFPDSPYAAVARSRAVP